MKKISIILSVLILITIAIPNTKLYAEDENLIEFTLDANNNDLQAVNTNYTTDQYQIDNEVVSKTDVVSNNNHFDSNIPNSKKEVRQANAISASEWIIVLVWGITVLISSFYIKKIKRFN